MYTGSLDEINMKYWTGPNIIAHCGSLGKIHDINISLNTCTCIHDINNFTTN